MSLARIEERFREVRARGRAAFMPYLTLGYPSLPGSFEAIQGLLAGGADLLELGIPFSDPLADGPVLQEAAQQAIRAGARVDRALELVARIRRQDRQVPVVLLVYANTVSARGFAFFAREAADAGADGLILPDWPVDEAGDLLEALHASGLAYVGLVTPASSPDRIARVAAASQGFLYAVSVTGVTGERQGLSRALAPLVRRIRSASSLPVAAGFGISRPQDAREAAAFCDGVIVGSALARRLAEAGQEPPGPVAEAFARSFTAHLTSGTGQDRTAAGVRGGLLEPPGGREWV